MLNMQLTISESTTLYSYPDVYEVIRLVPGDKVKYISHTRSCMILVEYQTSKWYMPAKHTKELK